MGAAPLKAVDVCCAARDPALKSAVGAFSRLRVRKANRGMVILSVVRLLLANHPPRYAQ
jgi:hypothetical protein